MKTRISIPYLFHSILRLFIACSLLAALFLGGQPAQPVHAAITILYAAPGWSPAGNGTCTSWANACLLEHALSIATPGTEIWAGKGGHYALPFNIFVPWPQTYPQLQTQLQLKDGVAMYGGFSGTETDRSQRDPAANVTGLNGYAMWYTYLPGAPPILVFHITHVPTVVIAQGGPSTVLDGFAISQSNPFYETINIGGGIIVSGSPTISNIIINDNYANMGGGMFIAGGGPTLSNITFMNNHAANGGGGLFIAGGSPTLSNITFINNGANDGGGMYNDSGSPGLNNVTFSNNSGGNGAGMYNKSGSPTLSNVTFQGNSATAKGGGMFNESGNPTFTNVTFSGNSAVTNGGGLENASGNLVINNSILWNNTAPSGPQTHAAGGASTLTYSDVQDGCPAGTTCTNILSADPLLGMVGTYGGSTQVYPLLPGSPAIDAGDDATCAASDQRAITRPQGPHCDMGAFESRGFHLALTGGDPQSAVRSTAFDQPLSVSVSSAYGEPVDGGKVSFTAPASGASAVLSGSPAAILDGETNVTATANAIDGAYTVTGGTSGAGAPVLFHLGNRNPNTLFAIPTGVSSGTCETWAHACDLQYALGFAPAGAEIWAAAGTYKPFAEDARTATFQLKNGVELYGGFIGTETARSQRDPGAHESILSGDIGTRSSSDNTYHVVTGSGADASAVLDGFTISGGNANGALTRGEGGGMYNVTGSSRLVNITFSGNNAGYGGGLFNYNNSCPSLIEVVFSDNSATFWGGGIYNSNGSSPTLNRFNFSSNTAGSYGGGMYNYNNSNPTLSRGAFNNNSAASEGGGIYNNNSSPALAVVGFSNNTASTSGGGMYNTSSSPMLTRITFTGNSSSFGGGLYNEDSSPALTDTTFNGNFATRDGGGMVNLDGSSPALSNVTFRANSADNYGGGMVNRNGSSPVLTNVTFSANAADSNGGGMYNNSSSPTIRSSILWGNTAVSGPQIYNSSSNPTVVSSDVQGGCPAGSTCSNILSTDPLLGTLGSYGGSMQVLPLLPGSTAIDAGDNATCAASDERNIVRPQGMRCDMGAFESQGFTLAITGGDVQATLINAAFAVPLQVSVTPKYASEPVNGGVVTFTAPSSGASVILTTQSITVASGSSSASETANGTGGPYQVSASASGANSVNFNLTNDRMNTAIQLTSSPNPSSLGQSVVFTATVTAAQGTPTGTINFFDGATQIGSANLDSSGKAQLSVSSLTVGTHSTLTAQFTGDAHCTGNTSSSFSHTVNKAGTIISVTSSQNPLDFRQPVTLNASVSPVEPGAGTPTGLVTFSAGTTVVGTGSVNASGGATLTISTLPVGSQLITAQYGGDTNFSGSTSGIWVQVIRSTLHMPFIVR